MASLNSFFPQIDQYDPKPMMEQNRQNALLDLQQKSFGMQQNKFAQEQTDAANKRKQEAAMTIGQAALTIQTEPEFNALRDFAVQNGFPEAAQYTFQQLPQIRAMFQQSGAFTGDSFQAQQANALVAREVASGVPIDQAKANVAAKMLERVVPVSPGGGVYAYDRFAGATPQMQQPTSGTVSSANPGAGVSSAPMSLDQINAGLLGTNAGKDLTANAPPQTPSTLTPLITPSTPQEQAARKALDTAAVETARTVASPIPETALKEIDAMETDILTAQTAMDKAQSWISRIDEGKFTPGLYNNITSTAKNYIGASDEQSRAFADFSTDIEVLRNAVLLLHKGVQTEGDAVRAMNTILANKNDPGVIKVQMAKLAELNNRAIQMRNSQIDRRLTNYGREATPRTQQPAAPPAAPPASGGVVRWEDLP